MKEKEVKEVKEKEGEEDNVTWKVSRLDRVVMDLTVRIAGVLHSVIPDPTLYYKHLTPTPPSHPATPPPPPPT